MCLVFYHSVVDLRDYFSKCKFTFQRGMIEYIGVGQEHDEHRNMLPGEGGETKEVSFSLLEESEYSALWKSWRPTRNDYAN